MKKKIILTSLSLIAIGILQAQNSASYVNNTAGIAGQDCSGFGLNAMMSNANATYRNTATGYNAMALHFFGDENTADGAFSLYNDGPTFFVRGEQNTAIGHSALYTNTDGDENSATGFEAMKMSVTGKQNTAFGSGALHENTNGNNNTATGFKALYFNGNGPFGQVPEANTAAGWKALYFNNDGSNNTAAGSGALQSNTFGNDNTAFGTNALSKNDNVGGDLGIYNTAIGWSVLFNNLAGDYSTSMGYRSLANAVSVAGNIAFGSEALTTINTGNNNLAIGEHAGSSITTGIANTCIGQGANAGSTNSYNTSTGQNALSACAGDYCAAMGYNAFGPGSATSCGNNCSALGYNITTGSTTYTNSTAVGSGIVLGAKNRFYLGNSSIVRVHTNATVTTVSDGRYKFNLSEEDVKGLDFILKLRPVIYNFDNRKYTEFLTKNLTDEVRKPFLEANLDKDAAKRYNGFIAQEIEKAAQESGYNFNGVTKPEDANGHYTLAYAKFVVPIVKAVQQQQKMIQANQKVTEDLQKDALQRKQLSDVLLKNSNAGSLEDGIFETGFQMDAQPNPFGQETTITYLVPVDVKTASLIIYDLQGKEASRAKLLKGNTTIKVSSESLSSGVYVYSIVADGKLAGSKYIVVTKK